MKNKLSGSIRAKLFTSLCIIVLSIIIFLIILNSFVLEKFYLYSKENSLKQVFKNINDYYNLNYSQNELDTELERIAISNNFDILIKNNYGINIYTSNKDFYSLIGGVTLNITNKNIKILESKENYTISEMKDNRTNITYVVLVAKLDNEYKLFIRMPITSIEESVQISNRFLYTIAIFIIIIGGTIVSIVWKRFSKPIEELNEIAKKMSNLDFSHKYKVSDSNDEIDDLGNSINIMSTKLETTIKQLRTTNMELEKDIEEKSQIDNMRKSFISDVSHELKTPIALIQGYSEGLIENVNTDEESRKFYAEVILDEATKMDKLVKQLLELMKLEYGKMEFNNTVFNIVEMEKEILRNSQVMIDKENMEISIKNEQEIFVEADEFYIDQVLTNYITNAIKYAIPINGIKRIEISNEIDINREKVIVRVFNTCENFTEEEMIRIWNKI